MSTNRKRKPKPTLHEMQPEPATEARAREVNPHIAVPPGDSFSIATLAAILGMAVRGTRELIENCKLYAERHGQRMHLVPRDAVIEYLQFPTSMSGKKGQEYSAQRRAKVLARYKLAGIDPPHGKYSDVLEVLPPGQRKDGKQVKRKRKAG